MTAAFPDAGPVTLKTNLQDYPVTRALKSGEVASDLVRFDFAGPKSAFEGFKPMVREGKFDAGELAIVTFLQAKVYGKPVVLLPAVVMGRFQHQCMLINAKLGDLKPKDIAGRRVGIRSYTQTTGAWVRGILQHEYGVDLSRVTWMCNDDAHLAEFRDPPGVERLAPGARKVDQMLLDGEIDGAFIGCGHAGRAARAAFDRQPAQTPRPRGPENTARRRSITCSSLTRRCRSAGRTWCGRSIGFCSRARKPPPAPGRHRLPALRGRGETARRSR